MPVGFETIVHHMPGEVLDVRRHYSYLTPVLDQMPEATREKITAAYPDQVRRLKEFSAAEMLAVGAAQKALEQSRLTPSDIDGLIVTQTGGKQFMPLLGTYIHLNMGFKLETIVRNIVDDNVSIINAAHVARHFVNSGLCRRVLIIAVAAQISGQIGFGVDLTDPLAPNFGDGAAAAIVSSQNLTCELLAYHFETYAVRPRTGGTLIANFGEVRPPMHPELTAKAGMENKSASFLVLEDPLFDDIAGQRNFITESLGRALQKAGLQPSSLSAVITPHIGHLEPRWRDDLAAAGYPANVLQNLRTKYGNIAVADVLVDLAEFAELGRFKSNDIVALWVPCFGVQLAVLLLRWV